MRNSKERNFSEGKPPSEKNNEAEEIKADEQNLTPSEDSLSEDSEVLEFNQESRARNLRKPLPEAFIEKNFKISSALWEAFIRGYKNKAMS